MVEPLDKYRDDCPVCKSKGSVIYLGGFVKLCVVCNWEGGS